MFFCSLTTTLICQTLLAAAVSPPVTAKVVDAPKVTASAPAPTNPPPVPAATQQAPIVASNPAPGYGITDMSEDEGPAFDVEKGFGLAKGTANTYAIPGMESMSAEEYRDKLQETISARQAKRREESLKSRDGKIGNANSQSYLDSLSKGENISDIDLSLSSSSSSSVQKSHSENEDLINELRVVDEIIVKTEMEVKSEKGNTERAEKDDTEEENEASVDVEEQSSKDEKQNILQQFSEENQSRLKYVVTKVEKSKTEKDLIRLSEWQILNSSAATSEKSDVVNTAEEKERHSLGQSSGFFIRNDDGQRQNPILGIDPSKKYAPVRDRSGSTSQRPASAHKESVFDRNSVGAIRKSPLKSQATAQSLAKTEMDQIQRPRPGSESPNYQTVSGRTTVGDLRKNKPQSSTSPTVSLVESEKRLRPTPGTDLPKYHKIEDRRSVGDTRKSAFLLRSQTTVQSLAKTEMDQNQRPTPGSESPNYQTVSGRTTVGDLRKNKPQSSTPSASMSSLVGSEKRQRPTPRTQSSKQSTSDVKTFPGDLRKSSNKPLPASSARISLAQTERRTRPAPSSDLPPHAQVLDRRSVGDFRDPATKKSQSPPTSLIENEARQRPAPSANSKDKGVSDSRGVVFKTTSSNFPSNTAASLITDEVRQRPVASQGLKDTSASDSRGVVFKTSASKSQPMSPSSLIADEVRQRPVASQGSKDTSASDSRGVVFKSSPSKPDPQATSSLIADEVRQRPVASQGLRKFAHVQDRTGDARVAAKKPVTQSPAPRPFVAVEKQARPPRASTDPRKFTRVENRVGPDIRRPVKEKATAAEAGAEASHWWNEKTQRPRTIPLKQAEALERDTQTQSSQVRKSHMKEEKRRREQETFQVPIAELQPSSLKALVKEERHDEEEKHTNPPPLKMLLTGERPIAGAKENPQKTVSTESQLKSLLKDEEKDKLDKKRLTRPPNAGDEWWSEQTKRPEGYAKHSQPIMNRDNHLRDYGDVVSQPGSDSTDEEDAHHEDSPDH